MAFITPGKAPELLSVLTVAFLDATRKVTLLASEVEQARRHTDSVKAIVMLDRAPRVLESKGLITARSPSGSQDQREAVLALDPDYKEACDRLNQIECFHELLKGKCKGIEWAFTAIKRILQEPGAHNYGSPHQKHGADIVDQALTKTPSGFGKPKL